MKPLIEGLSGPTNRARIWRGAHQGRRSGAQGARAPSDPRRAHRPRPRRRARSDGGSCGGSRELAAMCALRPSHALVPGVPPLQYSPFRCSPLMVRVGYTVPSTVMPPNATAALMLTTGPGKSSVGADNSSSAARCSGVRVTFSDGSGTNQQSSQSLRLPRPPRKATSAGVTPSSPAAFATVSMIGHWCSAG
jgi:hypothetical protein